MSTATHQKDISSLDFWSKPFDERDETFAYLRENEPVSWHPPIESQLLGADAIIEHEDPGFWAVTKHADVAAASRNAKVFSNAGGIFMEDFPPVVFEGSLSFIVTDAPRHTQLRNIVWSAFTPGHMRKLEDDIRRQVREVVDEIAPLGEADMSQTLAAEVPGRLFTNLFGVNDPDLRAEIMECAEDMASWSDPEICGDKEPIELFADAAGRLLDIALEETEKRRENPQDDLLTWVAEAEFEGQRLEEWEIGSFFALLSAAANDTTRHTIAHGLRAFQTNPDQKQILLDNLDNEKLLDTMAEELVRWGTPLLHFRRTVLSDVELGGKELLAGDKVALWYCSANRDEDQWPDAHRFDIQRAVNRHAGFGGGGPHYCMGASLARQTLKAVFKEVYSRMPDIEVGEPDLLTANVVHGVKRLPATWTRERS